MRLECRLASKDISGWVTFKGNQGTLYMEAVSPYATFVEETNQKIEAMYEKARGILDWLRDVGARLAGDDFKEARAELTKFRPRAIEIQTKVSKLKNQVAKAAKEYVVTEAADRKAYLEAKERKEAELIVMPAREKVAAAEEALRKLEELAKPLISLKEAERLDFATPSSLRTECQQLIDGIKDAVAKASACTKLGLEPCGSVAKAVKGPFLEIRKELAALGKQTDATKSRCDEISKALFTACGSIATAALAEVTKALRADANKLGLTADAFFGKLAGEADTITEEAMLKYCESSSLDLKHEHVKLACRGPMARRRFTELVDVYYVVVKEIALTAAFEIGGKDRPIRKAEADEVFQLLEGPAIFEQFGLTRMRARSLKDDVEGWITISGNKGTPFLKETGKPYYACNRKVALESAFQVGGAEPVRHVVAEEILELLEGPRKLATEFDDVLRARVKASKDGAQGFLTVRDQTGTVAEASESYYQVTTTTGLADEFDIKNCKMIRKLVVGEFLEVLEGPKEDEEKGIKRARARALKDDLTGWLAISGAKGFSTVYAKPSGRHYVLQRGAPLCKQATGEAAVVRELEEGEVVEVLSGPKAEKVEPVVLIKGRTLGDNSVGWLPLAVARPCRPFYTCKKETSIRETMSTDAVVVRELAVNETVEVLDFVADADAEVTWLRGSAERDGAIGWITVKDKTTTYIAAA